MTDEEAQRRIDNLESQLILATKSLEEGIQETRDYYNRFIEDLPNILTQSISQSILEHNRLVQEQIKSIWDTLETIFGGRVKR